MFSIGKSWIISGCKVKQGWMLSCGDEGQTSVDSFSCHSAMIRTAIGMVGPCVLQ